MKNENHPSPQFKDGKNGAFRFSRESITESGGGVVLFLILFCPRLESYKRGTRRTRWREKKKVTPSRDSRIAKAPVVKIIKELKGT